MPDGYHEAQYGCCTGDESGFPDIPKPGRRNRAPDVGWSITSKVIEMSAIRLLWNTDDPHSLSALYLSQTLAFNAGEISFQSLLGTPRI